MYTHIHIHTYTYSFVPLVSFCPYLILMSKRMHLHPAIKFSRILHPPPPPPSLPHVYSKSLVYKVLKNFLTSPFISTLPCIRHSRIHMHKYTHTHIY